jgi:hypothetical protein
MFDLDDFTTESLQNEMERRSKFAQEGKCWYCYRLLEFHTCKHANPLLVDKVYREYINNMMYYLQRNTHNNSILKAVEDAAGIPIQSVDDYRRLIAVKFATSKWACEKFEPEVIPGFLEALEKVAYKSNDWGKPE